MVHWASSNAHLSCKKHAHVSSNSASISSFLAPHPCACKCLLLPSTAEQPTTMMPLVTLPQHVAAHLLPSTLPCSSANGKGCVPTYKCSNLGASIPASPQSKSLKACAAVCRLACRCLWHTVCCSCDTRNASVTWLDHYSPKKFAFQPHTPNSANAPGQIYSVSLCSV